MFSFLKGSGDGKDQKSYLGLILIAAAIGIVLLLIGGTSDTKEKTVQKEEYKTERDELVIYQTYLEERIRALCQSVGGVSDVTVAVTLSGGFESVYATEWKDGNEKYVVLGSGSSASPLYLTRAAPKIAGIGIVCRGGSAERIRCELISLLGATFDVSTNRIYVTEAR